jgi:tetrahydromethanopterin S-methyltransferase subunit D
MLEPQQCINKKNFVDVLFFIMDKLFDQNNFFFHGLHLFKITNGFFYACNLLNVCGVIDGSHIPFFQKLDKNVITIFIDYYYR